MSASTNLKFFFARSLFDPNALGSIEALLLEKFPEWTARLEIVRSPRDRRLISDFGENVAGAAGERGALYSAMVARYGKGEFERRVGSVEIRGATRDLIVVLRLDELALRQISGSWFWGNGMTFQFRSAKRVVPPAPERLLEIATRVCAALSPAYAIGYDLQEYDHKNMDFSNGVRAIGLDVSRYLPGLYWFNFFGARYCELLGRERLLSAPGHSSHALDAGVAVTLAASPHEWNSGSYLSTEREVLTHLGAQHFFDRSDPEKITVAPDFDLPRRVDEGGIPPSPPGVH